MSEKFRWNSPQEWLMDKVDTDYADNATELRSVIVALIDKLDADTVQDIFQSEMSADGYFEPLSDGAPPFDAATATGMYDHD